MIRGLYRTHDSLLGDCVRVHWSAGDAGPVLPPQIYAALGGVPDYHRLPSRADYQSHTYLFEADLLETAE